MFEKCLKRKLADFLIQKLTGSNRLLQISQIMQAYQELLVNDNLFVGYNNTIIVYQTVSHKCTGIEY